MRYKVCDVRLMFYIEGDTPPSNETMETALKVVQISTESYQPGSHFGTLLYVLCGVRVEMKETIE